MDGMIKMDDQDKLEAGQLPPGLFVLVKELDPDTAAARDFRALLTQCRAEDDAAAAAGVAEIGRDAWERVAACFATPEQRALSLAAQRWGAAFGACTKAPADEGLAEDLSHADRVLRLAQHYDPMQDMTTEELESEVFDLDNEAQQAYAAGEYVISDTLSARSGKMHKILEERRSAGGETTTAADGLPF